MQQSTISLRVDQTLKRNFDSLCELFGLSTSAALNMFMKAVVRERRIPFEIKADDMEYTRQKAQLAFNELRRNASESGAAGMDSDEINAEIKAARNERPH